MASVAELSPLSANAALFGASAAGATEYSVKLPFPDRVLRSVDETITVFCCDANTVETYQQGLLEFDLAVTNVSTTGADARHRALYFMQQRGLISSDAIISDSVLDNGHDKIQSVCDSVVPSFVCHGEHAIDVDGLLGDLRSIGRREDQGRVFGLMVLTRSSDGQQRDDDAYSLDVLSCELDRKPTDHLFLFREWIGVFLDPEQKPSEMWRAFLPHSFETTNTATSSSSKTNMFCPSEQQATAGASFETGVGTSPAIDSPMMDQQGSPFSQPNSSSGHFLSPPIPYDHQQWQNTTLQLPSQYQVASQTPIYPIFTTSSTHYGQQPQQLQRPSPPHQLAPPFGVFPAAQSLPRAIRTAHTTTAATAATAARSQSRPRISTRKSPTPTPSPPLTPQQIQILTLAPTKIVGETLLQLASTMNTEHIKEHVDKLYKAKGGNERGLNTYTKNITNAIKSRALRQGRPYEGVRHEFNLQRKANGVKVNVAAAATIASLANNTYEPAVTTAPGLPTNAPVLAAPLQNQLPLVTTHAATAYAPHVSAQGPYSMYSLGI